MDCLRSFVLSAPSECSLPLRRVLLSLFPPVINGPDDFAERFPTFGGSVLDMQRESRKDLSGKNPRFFQRS